jgi:hypothetical protein
MEFLVYATAMDDTSDAPAVWGLNVGGFERAYPGWALWSPRGTGLVERRNSSKGLAGPLLRGESLDDIARQIEASAQTDATGHTGATGPS